MFIYPSDTSGKAVDCPQVPGLSRILDYTLRALDPSIKSVEKSKEVENTYIIHMESRDVIIQDGEVIKSNVLSSGTKAGNVQVLNVTQERITRLRMRNLKQ